MLNKEEHYHIHITTMNYISPLKQKKNVRSLLETTTKNKNKHVTRRTRQILKIPPIKTKKTPTATIKTKTTTTAKMEKPTTTPKKNPEPNK